VVPETDTVEFDWVIVPLEKFSPTKPPKMTGVVVVFNEPETYALPIVPLLPAASAPTYEFAPLVVKLKFINPTLRTIPPLPIFAKRPIAAPDTLPTLIVRLAIEFSCPSNWPRKGPKGTNPAPAFHVAVTLASMGFPSA
jgi:hypothetical protein